VTSIDHVKEWIKSKISEKVIAGGRAETRVEEGKCGNITVY
jgi:hypothetical protein